MTDSPLFIDHLVKEPHALAFAGQSTPWTSALADLTQDADLAAQLRARMAVAEQLLSPVAADLLATTGRAESLFDFKPTGSALLGQAAMAAYSVPGIALVQYGALADLVKLGYPLVGHPDSENLVGAFGHSQGVLGEHMVEAARNAGSLEAAAAAVSELLALATLIGVAGTRLVRSLGIARSGESTPMLSIKGATRKQVEALIERTGAQGTQGQISIAVTNSATHYVLSGYPADLAAFWQTAEAEQAVEQKERDDKLRGGRVFTPILEYLDVTLPFHSPLLADAVEQVVTWASACGLDKTRVRQVASEVLVEPVDWAGRIGELVAGSADPTRLWIVDLGPGRTAAKLTFALVNGTGVGLVDASTGAGRERLVSNIEPDRTQNWRKFAPKVLDTPTGKKVSTAFTRLTGRAPVLLPGMTPTTVDPEIVAAAANAGYWAELAGGGQVTAEVLDRHLKELEELLHEGQNVQFNAMFMDRYLWNLQFGASRLVPKKRASGAPIDGVVISAGIPEFDEAVELISTLHADGFPYVAFKPGTVAQIRQVIRIAQAVAPAQILMQVEGGEAGGHHSWESLEDLLLATYGEVRDVENLILLAGGGIGTPERAADFISGQWARAYGRPDMPVDGVMVGTAVMTAKEAHTSEAVKQMLVDTPGIPAHCEDGDPFAVEGWVGSGQVAGGVSSGLSHLRADIYEVENASARCGRLIVEILNDPEHLQENLEVRRDEIIAALNQTAKPFFGDLATMTYLEMAERFATLTYPWVDPTYVDRFWHLLQRIEARVSDTESGEIETLFAAASEVEEPQAAIAKLREAYPQAANILVTPADVAWFPTLCREYPKPMPFVPVIDGDLLRWWGQDQLWQSEDPRYSADSVRAIPGPIAVAGITTKNEPVADILGRFESAMLERVEAAKAEVVPAVARLQDAVTVEEFIRRSPNLSWCGHITSNPAYGTAVGDAVYELIPVASGQEEAASAANAAPARFDLDIHLDTFWDDDPDGGLSKHAVRDIVVPLVVDDLAAGRMPVVDTERLPQHVYRMLAATAGIGNTSITGDQLTEMPQVTGGVAEFDAEGTPLVPAVGHPADPRFPFGQAHATYTLSANLGLDHGAATGEGLATGQAPGSSAPGSMLFSKIAPDALVGPAWPAIYAGLGSVFVEGFPVIEGLLNAVHLDHLIRLEMTEEELLTHVGETIHLTSWAENYLESASGRVVVVNVIHALADGTVVAHETERFAIRGRAFSEELPPEAPALGGVQAETVDTARRLLRRFKVQAPSDMTAFARTSGDFNPIHTSVRGARISGLTAPLVHGMWLSATAQHAVQATLPDGSHFEIAGWTYSMYGMVQLDDIVEISVERVGKVAGGGLILEVTCRHDGQILSKGTAITRAPKTAYVYPGQGIQQQGMMLDERAKSPAVREIWERADVLTRDRLGFSITAVVRDNPTELTANGTTYYHPDGLLNLTQFTQVALATVAFAQTARLKEAGALIWPAYYAGHSLGEYNALASFGEIFPLEVVLELVFYRGSTMHQLIDRDEEGRSNYRMGALRPNQFGVSDDEVTDYVNSVSEATGEFLQIVNYNLAGAQYAVAGTIAGLDALAADAGRCAREYGGKPPFMFIPGVDVPFHSKVLFKGVAEFRDKLDELLPAHIDYQRLVGKYIPNLVATPFQMTREFAETIVEAVPSERIREVLADQQLWDSYAADEQKLGRLLLTELLSWQFASPVRWIETQALLFTPETQGGLGVQQFVEIGLGNSPTLANLGANTLLLPQFADANVTVFNVGRDEARVYMTDTDPAVQDEVDEGAAESSDSGSAGGAAGAGEAGAAGAGSGTTGAGDAGAGTSGGAGADAVAPAPAAASAPAVPVATSGERPDDLPFQAADAIDVLLAYSAKVRLDQIGAEDTTDTLTNGVSSRRNQLLMDISAELGVASVEGAAEATIGQLAGIVNKAAPHYKPFGSVLTDIIRERVSALFGAAGVKLAHIEKRITSVWQLGPGWVAATVSALILNTREGASTRGGDLATLPASAAATQAAANDLIDAAVVQVGQERGVAVALPSAGGVAGGGVVDSAALDAFAEKVTGSNGILAATARFVLNQLGTQLPPTDEEEDDSAAIVAAVEAELGADWPKLVEPRFDADKAILFDDRWASAREDLAHLYHEGRMPLGSFVGLGADLADQAKWYEAQAQARGDEQLAAEFARIAVDALTDRFAQAATANTLSDTNVQPASTNAQISSKGSSKAASAQASTRFVGQVAVVTGVAPRSIAAQVVAGLLEGGATVIATSHSFRQETIDWAKQCYRDHGTVDAKLWLLPANLTSYRDCDSLVNWVGEVQRKVTGATSTVTKPAYVPDLFFPFAAPPVHGTMADAGALFENQARLMLWGVERSIAGLANLGADTDVQHRLHVVLPGSPNRGIFGGDGAYGEVKSAFDAIVTRARAEVNWANRVTFAHPKIGWVQGTSLMGGNDPLVEVVQKRGLKVWTTEEIAEALLQVATLEARAQAATTGPIDVDLTGGLGSESLDIRALRAEAEADAATSTSTDDTTSEAPATIRALPTPRVNAQAQVDLADWQGVEAKPEEQIVIVSIGEVGPWGSGRTRLEAELGIDSNGDVELSAAGVLELAWNMGLLEWNDSPNPGWYDQDGNLVPEEDIVERFRDEVIARSGIRPFEADMGQDYLDGTDTEAAEIFLDRDLEFSVPTEELAREYVRIDPERTRISRDEESGEWLVTRLQGASVAVPRRATMSRTVGGQFPMGFDPQKWGIPSSMVGNVDPIALWNIVTAVDAYISAGFSPTEILHSIHPSLVASTQGTGFGGMHSMRRLYLDRFLNRQIPSDILQEALPNVVAAHVMQSYVGGYGNMIQPVSACATAAISMEEAADKIALGKADFVVAGAIDDIGVESVIGFGNMNATANSAEMYGKGIKARFFSRANDRRRGGFLEAQGGGTILLTRGDIALKLGLPVAAVVGYINSFADGAHTSIPAPGLGALAAGRGGTGSKLATQLARLGVSADDIAVVSKHDTSTNANDPNESELHNTLAHAIGRTAGNPLYVISQKTITGHAKGGACVFQINGLAQLFQTGVIPANAALDCVDPALERDEHMVWLKQPLHLGRRVKAGLVTSLGFGHVSGLAAIVSPGAFEAAVAKFHGEDALEKWRERANARLAAGQRRREAGMMGQAALYEPIDNRRFAEDSASYDAHEVEKAMLLDVEARLGESGVFGI